MIRTNGRLGANFANPSGVSLSAGVRRGLIEVAADHDLEGVRHLAALIAGVRS
jgi:hypothetical protein